MKGYLTVVDLSKLNFYSNVNYMKRDSNSGTTTLTLPAYGNTVTHTVTHNLGYVPFFQVMSDQDASGNIWSAEKINLYTETSLTGVDPPTPALTSWATTTTLVINFTNLTDPVATGTRDIWWLIYVDYGNVT